MALSIVSVSSQKFSYESLNFEAVSSNSLHKTYSLLSLLGVIVYEVKLHFRLKLEDLKEVSSIQGSITI